MLSESESERSLPFLQNNNDIAVLFNNLKDGLPPILETILVESQLWLNAKYDQLPAMYLRKGLKKVGES